MLVMQSRFILVKMLYNIANISFVAIIPFCADNYPGGYGRILTLRQTVVFRSVSHKKNGVIWLRKGLIAAMGKIPPPEPS
jgi:hypothetical protein